MALPLAFAACTSEDLDVVEKNATLQDGRQTVENVTLNFSKDAVESRLAYDLNEGEYVWEASDEIGACLMDVITEKYQTYGRVPYNRAANWSTWFKWVDYIQTNYVFTRDENKEWGTEAKMLEGNYFFHYPYKKSLGLREAYSFYCSEQTVGTDITSLAQAFTDNNAFVGYGAIFAGDQEGEALKDVTLLPVFGATGITLHNIAGSGVNESNTFTVNKIVLRGSQVFDKATINPSSMVNPIAQATKYSYWNGTNISGFNVDQYLGYTNGADYNSQNSGYNSHEAIKAAIHYGVNVSDSNNGGRVEVNLSSGNKLVPGAKINIIAMLAPKAIVNNGGAITGAAVMDIHTDKGLLRNVELNQKYTSDNGLTSSTGNVINLTTDKAFAELGAGDAVTFSFDATALDVPQVMDIFGTDELAELIHWNVGTSDAITANLKENVNITKAMAEELLAKTCKITTATINGGGHWVTIDADAPEAILDRFNYVNVNIEVMGTQTLSKSKTYSNTSNETTYNPIRNKGVINIKANDVVAEISNYNANAELNVNATRLSGKINNYGTVNVAAGKVVKSNLVNGGVVNNEGNVELLNNLYYGTFNNKGQLGKYVTSVNNIDRDEVVNNRAWNGYVYLNGVIKNVGNGVVYVGKNEGNLRAEGTSQSFVNDNGNGNIIITDLDEDNGNVIAKTIGNIVQEIAEESTTDDVDVRANMLWLSSKLSVIDQINELTKEYESVNLTKRGKNGHVKVTAVGRSARIDGTGNSALIMSDITVNADAALTLNKIDVKLYSAGESNSIELLGYKNNVTEFRINTNASLISGDKKYIIVNMPFESNQQKPVYNTIYNLSGAALRFGTGADAGTY